MQWLIMKLSLNLFVLNNNQDLLRFLLPGSSEESRRLYERFSPTSCFTSFRRLCPISRAPAISYPPRSGALAISKPSYLVSPSISSAAISYPPLSPNLAVSYLPLSRARLPHIPHNLAKKPVSFEKCDALKRIFYVFPLRPTFTAKIMLFEQFSHHL